MINPFLLTLTVLLLLDAGRQRPAGVLAEPTVSDEGSGAAGAWEPWNPATQRKLHFFTSRQFALDPVHTSRSRSGVTSPVISRLPGCTIKAKWEVWWSHEDWFSFPSACPALLLDHFLPRYVLWFSDDGTCFLWSRLSGDLLPSFLLSTDVPDEACWCVGQCFCSSSPIPSSVYRCVQLSHTP